MSFVIILILQVLKICLNHALSASVVSMIQEKTANSWTWVAQDFSDGELATMTFALRSVVVVVVAVVVVIVDVDVVIQKHLCGDHSLLQV